MFTICLTWPRRYATRPHNSSNEDRPMLPACIARIVLALLAAAVMGSAALAQRGEPGAFDYYVLALSWSPTYCADGGEERNDPQCTLGQKGRPYAFVLHGLWPQYERGWPQ